MKTYTNSVSAKSLLGLLAVLCLAFSLTGCKEDIDDSNYAIAEDETVTDYVSRVDNLSLIKSVFDRVRLGNADNASSLTAVLSARGNYTVFAPTNEAVRKYVAHLTQFDEEPTDDVSKITYEQAQMIAYSCIIDNDSETAYETPDFPAQGSFNKPNLSDRLLTVAQDDNDNPFVINGTSRIIKENIELANGVIHIVDAVVWQSPQSVPEMIIAANNMKIMGRLLEETTLKDSMMRDRDLDYENTEHEERHYWSAISYSTFEVPQKRYYGYTGFIEPDEVFARDWGIVIDTLEDGSIDNWAEVLDKLREKIEPTYGTTDRDNLASPENALNRFVAYHFTDAKMPYDKLTHHFTEYGYQWGSNAREPQTVNYSIDVWEYYTTIGKYRALLKVLQVPTGDHEIYLNRITKYNNKIDGDYKEISTQPYTPGTGINIKISPDNGLYNNIALNGYYYPIDGILLNNLEVQNKLGSERLRIDLNNFFPETISNSRRMGNFTMYPMYPVPYFDNIVNSKSGTECYYLMAMHNGGGGWGNLQGDEWSMSGLFDVTMRIPPVPRTQTYEIRMGLVQNPYRGMAQVYFGEDPNRLQPTGLPLDVRQSTAADDYPALEWANDDQLGDEQSIIVKDQDLRRFGYMKAPNYFTQGDGRGDHPMRRNGFGTTPTVRRIITTQMLDKDKTYYIRFKSALKKLDSMFFMDYFEFVPTNIYNGDEPEDIW